MSIRRVVIVGPCASRGSPWQQENAGDGDAVTDQQREAGSDDRAARVW